MCPAELGEVVAHVQYPLEVIVWAASHVKEVHLHAFMKGPL